VIRTLSIPRSHTWKYQNVSGSEKGNVTLVTFLITAFHASFAESPAQAPRTNQPTGSWVLSDGTLNSNERHALPGRGTFLLPTVYTSQSSDELSGVPMSLDSTSEIGRRLSTPMLAAYTMTSRPSDVTFAAL
jgi:hypothetical protein